MAATRATAAAPRAFDAAVFDMDGLLLDSERVIMDAWLAVAAGMGVPMRPAHYIAVVGRAEAESEAILAAVFGDRERYRFARDAVAESLEHLQAGAGFPVKPGATRLLDALAARGVPCAVASSSARGEIEARLATAGLLGRFVAWAGGDEVARGKPDAAVYRLAAERIGIAPARCLAFEDSRNGARSALAAGAGVILVPDLVRPTAALAARSLGVLASLDDALPHVPAWFPAAGRRGAASCGS